MRRTLSLLFLAGAALSLASGQSHPLLSSGPLLGYSEMTEVAIWTQTKSPASVQIEYKPLGATAWQKSEVKNTTAAGDHIATIIIDDLPMGTKFDYRLLLNGRVVPRSYPLQFQTQRHWRWATNPPQPPEFTFAFGSCAYFNDPTPGYDRPGTPYGGDYEIFDALHKKRPDLMLWMGDNFYLREMDWLTERAMRKKWRTDRAFPGLQPLIGSTHNYATWDDHEFGPNDSDSSYRLKGTALQIFREYWPQVVYGTPETPGVFTRFEWGDVEFFMLDNRYHRTPNRFPDGYDRVMYGKAQMDWLKQALVSSDKTFKVIVAGGQMINPLARFESFTRFGAEQKDLFDFIAASRVSGILFLSGDRHHSELLKRQWPGAAYPFYEYTSSPLTSGAGLRPNEQVNEARVPGTFVENKRNFGQIQVTGPWQNRRLILTAHDKTGAELWRREISQQELTAPRQN